MGKAVSLDLCKVMYTLEHVCATGELELLLTLEIYAFILLIRTWL